MLKVIPTPGPKLNIIRQTYIAKKRYNSLKVEDPRYLHSKFEIYILSLTVQRIVFPRTVPLNRSPRMHP